MLDAGGFVAGRPVSQERIERTPDGALELEHPTGNMTGKLPLVEATSGPEGFAGDLQDCVRWEYGDAPGQIFDSVTTLRIHTSHTFTMDERRPCSHDAELNDETFPSQSRWLILYAK